MTSWMKIRVPWTILPAAILLLAGSVAVAAFPILEGPSFAPGDLGTPGESVGDQEDVDIVAGGGSFLAVWTDMRTSLFVYDGQGHDQSGHDVYAARLDAAGNLIDSTPIVVSQDFGTQQDPAVAWNGQNWLVVWENQTPSETGGAPPGRCSARGSHPMEQCWTARRSWSSRPRTTRGP